MAWTVDPSDTLTEHTSSPVRPAPMSLSGVPSMTKDGPLRRQTKRGIPWAKITCTGSHGCFNARPNRYRCTIDYSNKAGVKFPGGD